MGPGELGGIASLLGFFVVPLIELLYTAYGGVYSDIMVVPHVFSQFRGGHTNFPVVAAAGLVDVLVSTLELLKNNI